VGHLVKNPRKLIPLGKLNLNTANPRFPPVESQDEALLAVVKSERDTKELFSLAKHIATYGLNPSETAIIFEDDEDNMIVKDGNRRITAIRAMLSPAKVPFPDKSYIRKFRKLKSIARENGVKLSRIPCSIFDIEEEADEWVWLRHTGKNNGVGTVDWNSMMTFRFKDHQMGNRSITLQAYDFMERHADEILKQKLSEQTFPTSTLKRLLSNKEFRKAIGFEYSNGILKYGITKDEALRNITKVVEDLATKKKQVGDVYTTNDQLGYANELKAEGFPVHSQWTGKLVPVEPEATPTNVSKRIGKQIKKEKPLSSSRSKLIPDDCILSIDDPRTNNVYLELKKLPVKSYPNATAVLFRVFLELSLNRYIEKNGVRNINRNSELVNKIMRVKDHFIQNGIMSEYEMVGIMELCNQTSDQPIPMTREFNACVHNEHYNPKPDNLKSHWDDIQPFMMKLWE
jgi:hypothetical protein